jgi:hypothetical protein
VTAPGRFGRFAREELERQAHSLALTLVDDPAEAQAVLACGRLRFELELFRRLIG